VSTPATFSDQPKPGASSARPQASYPRLPKPIKLACLGVVGALLSTACGDDTTPTGCDRFECVEAVAGVSARHAFEVQNGVGDAAPDFYAAPFPSENRRTPGGGVDLSGFPNPTATKVVSSLISMLERDAHGFGVSSAIYFSLSDAPEGSADEPIELVSYAASVAAEHAAAFVINADPDSVDYLVKQPVRAEFMRDGGPFGAPNLVSLSPLQGAPFASATLHAGVLLRSAFTTPLGQSRELVALLNGIRPPGLSDAAFTAYRQAVAALDAAGVQHEDVAALAAFVTDDPTVGMAQVLSASLDRGVPALSQPLQAKEVFDDFCVYEGRLKLPVYQAGAPPYDEAGGGWTFDVSGAPIVDHEEEARVVITIPRGNMPSSGFPVVLFSRTGGGGDRPLVDRGVRGADGAPLEPGSGPAREFARVGYAGVSLDGPHGGIRNITHGDEQFLMFNVGNMLALRDNVRQSALELALGGTLLERLRVDVTSCAGAQTGGQPARFDPALKVLMGHSMGATITPLTLATEPSFKGIILSGAGGSWIENVMYKKKPVAVKIFAEILLGISNSWSLHEADPALNLFQWAGEPADPPIYARRILHHPPQGFAPRHVLMQQGIVDNYILPPIANALSLAAGLDLAGGSLDVDDPRLASFAPLSDRLRFSGGSSIALPAEGNVSVGGARYTAVVVQHPEDGVEDGHEVLFQTETPKAQYRCFLSTLAAGKTPHVPAAGGTCPQ